MTLPSDAAVDSLLAERGVPARRVARLRDALMDYIDQDDLVRLNGAESREYERERRAPPANRRLLLPRELYSVMGWDELAAGPQAIREEELTTFYAGALNLNTAPASLLPLWLPDCPQLCEAFIRRRAEVPYRSGAEIEAVHGIQLPGDEAVNYRFMAADYLRLTLWGRSGAAWRIHVRLTPLADRRGPWSVLATYPVARPSNEAIEDTGSDLFAPLPLQ